MNTNRLRSKKEKKKMKQRISGLHFEMSTVTDNRQPMVSTVPW